ncbi:MAG: hypothetical protein ACLUE7_03095 [Lachnospirales bacterium]
MIFNGLVERKITKKGYLYEADFSSFVAKANYTFGLTLRKICTDKNYVLKQEKCFEKIFAKFLIFNIYTNRCSLNIFLYEKDKKIGETLNDKNNGISIKINDEILKFNVVENKEHIINVTNKDIILFSIIKSRLRFGRKNIYKIKSMEWKYDIELLILLVAFCDVVFFPEWRLFSWGELEYDLLEIDLKKNKNKESCLRGV